MAEAHYPTHGIAGGIGVVTMAVGVVLAISGLGAGVLLGLLAGVAIAGTGAAVLTASVKQAGAVKHRRIRTGAEGIIGHVGVVRSWAEPTGKVLVDGALWQARRSATQEDELARQGDPVVVERLTRPDARQSAGPRTGS